jgi:N-acetylneuraminic acid mutarotase
MARRSPLLPAFLSLSLMLLGACSTSTTPLTVTPLPPLATAATSQPTTSTSTVVPPLSTSTAVPPYPTVTPTRAPTRTPVDVAQLPHGEWVRLRGMANARSETAVAVLGDLIYLPGGAIRAATFLQPVSDFSVFDPARNRWSALPNLRLKLHHAQAVGHAGRVYVFGGLSDCDDCAAPLHAAAYDPATQSWTELASIPGGRIAGAAVSLGDYIYLVGGQPADPFDTAFPTLLRYDPAADAWTALAPLPTPREHINAVAYAGRLYALGGRWNNHDYDLMEIYDPATDAWSAGPSMRFPRAGFGAAVVAGRLYVAGGELLSVFPEQVVTTVEVFDFAFNRWVEVFDLPGGLGLHGVSAAGLGDVLYVVGGSHQPGQVDPQGTVWAYRP